VNSPKPNRGGLRSRWVLLALLGLMLVAVLAFGWLYYRLVYFERVAVRHVAPSATLAVRLDLEQVLLFAPVREHILPVVLRGADGKDDATQLERIEAATGINLGMDLREVVLVQRASDAQYGEPQWGVVIAGLFPKAGVMAGLGLLLADEPLRGCRVDADRLRCAHPEFVATQASDGALIVAATENFLNELLPSSDAYQTLGLLAEGPGSFGLLLSDAFTSAAPLVRMPGFRDLDQVARLQGHLVLGEETTLHLEAWPKSGRGLSSWAPRLTQLRDATLLLLRLRPGQDYGGERALLSRLQFEAGQQGTVRATATWLEAEIDQAAKSAAAGLSAWLQLP
jgi:hypothetical protein